MIIERLPIYYRKLNQSDSTKNKHTETKRLYSTYHCNNDYKPIVFYKVISKIVSIGDYKERHI
jgi:hypothetical protein